MHNDTEAPVYLGFRTAVLGVFPLYEVHDSSGRALFEPGPCITTCQRFLDGKGFGDCDDDGLPSDVTRINPGETIASDWSGRYVDEVQFPRACDTSGSAGNGPLSCIVDRRVEPGSYTFAAEAGTDFICNASAGGCSTCEAGSDGCVVHGARVTGSQLSATLRVDLDASYGIYGSAGGGDASSIPQARPIELVFRNQP